MRHRKLIQTMAITGLLIAMALPVQASVEVEAASNLVTRGRFVTLAGGADLGYQISGTAVMVRSHRGGGATRVQVAVRGLEPNTTYKVHVHNGFCGDDPAGGGHYQDVMGGPVDSVNEIWPSVTTNGIGAGIGTATHDARARADARSVVIHWPDDSSVRLACVDLN